MLKKDSRVEDSNKNLEKLKTLKTFKGQQMIFTVAQQRDIYFQQLNNEW